MQGIKAFDARSGKCIVLWAKAWHPCHRFPKALKVASQLYDTTLTLPQQQLLLSTKFDGNGIDIDEVQAILDTRKVDGQLEFKVAFKDTEEPLRNLEANTLALSKFLTHRGIETASFVNLMQAHEVHTVSSGTTQDHTSEFTTRIRSGWACSRCAPRIYPSWVGGHVMPWRALSNPAKILHARRGEH